MKKKLLFWTLLIFSVTFFFSCKENRLKKDLLRIMTEKVELPTGLPVKIKDRDTLLDIKTEAYAKLVIYHDSTACVGCKVSHLGDWKDVLLLSKATQEKFIPIFIFAPQKEKINELFLTLRASRNFSYPVYIDEEKLFEKYNPLIAKDSRFHVFLMDKNNQIKLAGNPLYNDKLWELYQNTINELIQHQGILPEE